MQITIHSLQRPECPCLNTTKLSSNPPQIHQWPPEMTENAHIYIIIPKPYQTSLRPKRTIQHGEDQNVLLIMSVITFFAIPVNLSVLRSSDTLSKLCLRNSLQVCVVEGNGATLQAAAPSDPSPCHSHFQANGRVTRHGYRWLLTQQWASFAAHWLAGPWSPPAGCKWLLSSYVE